MSRVGEWLYWQPREVGAWLYYKLWDLGVVVTRTKDFEAYQRDLFEMGRDVERARMGQQPRDPEPRKRHLALVPGN